eukprot:5010225-Alexandrium_andersonii.AAC.1
MRTTDNGNKSVESAPPDLAHVQGGHEMGRPTGRLPQPQGRRGTASRLGRLRGIRQSRAGGHPSRPADRLEPQLVLDRGDRV